MNADGNEKKEERKRKEFYPQISQMTQIESAVRSGKRKKRTKNFLVANEKKAG
jgi:hypothetical protein